MGLCLGKTSTWPRRPEIAGASEPGTPSWPDLPPEVTGLVLSRLLSHDDRLSLAAVCHDWRLATQQHRSLLPPAMPCINLGNGVYHSLANGKVRPFAPSRGSYIASTSFGRWLLYNDQRRATSRCFLRAPSSRAIKVPCLYIRRGPMLGASSITDTVDMGTDVKMVVCLSRLVVGIFRRHSFAGTTSSSGVPKRSNIACFRPAQQQPPATWLPVSSCDNYSTSDLYTDIAFFQGKIFALTWFQELFCYDDFFDNDQQQMRHRLISHGTDEQTPWSNSPYLVVSSDKQKLLMVRWNKIFTNGHQRATDLRVFEADFSEGQWSEVNDLAGQVLFLGRNCSKAFKTGSLEHCDLGFPGGNCLFVLGDELSDPGRHTAVYDDRTPRYWVYDMVSGETSLVTLDIAHNIERFRSGWFFPDD